MNERIVNFDDPDDRRRVLDGTRKLIGPRSVRAGRGFFMRT